jgi:MFS transporter, NNP family, nitrate/nitrite transporter
MGVAAGFYLPSGIASLTELVAKKDLGKAFGIFEIAPNLAFVVTPFLIELLLSELSWQEVLRWIGITSITAGIFFVFVAKGGNSRGEVPNSKMIKSIGINPSLWIMMVLFTLGLGASFGVYSMIPLYLVSESGMERQWANTLLGLSRISALGMNLLAGWVTDHLGLKPTLKTIFLISGLMTLLLGIVRGNWIVLIVFLQPMFATCFFTPGFAALSRIVPPSHKNVVVSLTIPVSFLIGGGMIPAGIGFIGAMGFFPIGFMLLGGILLGGIMLVGYLKFIDD